MIILTRSPFGNAGTRAASFVTEMSELGCAAKVLQCDITIKEDLALCLEQIRSSLPPVRGVVQAAMVLQVCIALVSSPDSPHDLVRRLMRGRRMPSWNK